MTLEAEFIMKIHVQCKKDMEVKDDGSGYQRVIPIIGGTIEGKISGTVVPGGADWNTQLKNGVARAFAKYLLKTNDGFYIAIENEGKIAEGQDTFIKTSPRFQVDSSSKYAWLNSGVYVGTLSAGKNEGQVEITVYRMK